MVPVVVMLQLVPVSADEKTSSFKTTFPAAPELVGGHATCGGRVASIVNQSIRQLRREDKKHSLIDDQSPARVIDRLAILNRQDVLPRDSISHLSGEQALHLDPVDVQPTAHVSPSPSLCQSQPHLYRQTESPPSSHASTHLVRGT
jgi:hypothetical protein